MKKKLLFMLPLTVMVLSGCDFKRNTDENIDKDNVVYDDPSVVDFAHPNTVYNSPTNRPASTSVNKVVIHYHNEDGDNANRAVWVWTINFKGAQYVPQQVSSDGKDMTLTLDLLGDQSELMNKTGVSFIIKKKDTWTGQTADIKILFAERTPDESGKIEIWTMPGEGNDLEVYDSYEETIAARAVYSSFTNWQTIKVIATETPSQYRVYAFTTNYFKLNNTQKKEYRDRYLLKTGIPESAKDVVYNDTPCKQFNIPLNYTIRPNVQYVVETTYASNVGVWKSKLTSFDHLYNTKRFKEFYTYEGDDLGATWSSSSTTFKVWAPTASFVRLMLYKSGVPVSYTDESIGRIGDDSWGGYDMVFRPGGIWEATIANKDLHGTYYNYSVANSLGTNEVVDPYAKSCNINGDRGLVLDFSKTNPTGWDDIPEVWDKDTNGFDIDYPNRLSVYEVHIRDLTMDETWTGHSKRGTFPAFVESGTTYTKGDVTVKTGFDHINEMGFKAVQILPFFDQDNIEDDEHMAFNWGYNPKNYNCLEGGYSTNPFDGRVRVKEFKELVQAFANNEQHTRIIMDVVYNHVSSVTSSPFHKLMPRYFFRYTSDGKLYEGSGCGNEFKSDSVMGSKYIIDSLCFWAKEYKIKGFRFDLMGLIDVDTMAAAKKALYKIDPDIVMYGEGWTGDGSGYSWEEDKIYPVHGAGGTKYGAVAKAVYTLPKLTTTDEAIYLGSFNDKGRDVVSGNNNFGSPDFWGFISQGADNVGKKNYQVFEMMRGNNTNQNGGGNPNQVVNYLSCHDNWTLYDQLHYTLSNDGGITEPNPADLMAAITSCESAIMASNGIGFMHSGEELFRTKVLDPVKDADYDPGKYDIIYGQKITHDSYTASDECNSFKWDRKIEVDGVSSTKYFNSLCKAIKLHNEMPKYAFDSNFQSSNIDCWNDGGTGEHVSGGTAIGIRIGNYYIYINGRNTSGCSLEISNAVKSSTLVFNSHSTSLDGTVTNTDISITGNSLSLKAYQLVIYRV